MDYFKKDIFKKVYFKARLPKEQRYSIDKIFKQEEYIFDVQKIGSNAIINAINKDFIQEGIDCEGSIYYLFNKEQLKIDYEIIFSKKLIKVYIADIEDEAEDRMIIQHYLDMFINALVEAHTGSFECEMINSKKPEKLKVKTVEINNEVQNVLNESTINKEENNSQLYTLSEKTQSIKEIDKKIETETFTNEEERMISLAKVYSEINKQQGDNVLLNIRVYFENNCFGVAIESTNELIVDFVIANKEYYTRKEKIDSLVSAFDTADFIESQVNKLVEKQCSFRKFFVMDQEIDENIGCPDGYTGYWNKNGNYIAM